MKIPLLTLIPILAVMTLAGSLPSALALEEGYHPGNLHDYTQLQKLAPPGAGSIDRFDTARLRTLLAKLKPGMIHSPGDLQQFGMCEEFVKLAKRQPDKAGLIKDYMDLITAVPPLLGEPKGWGEFPMFTLKGPVGLLMGAAMDAGGRETFTSILDLCISRSDKDRLDALLEQVVYRGDTREYKDLIMDRKARLEESEKSPESGKSPGSGNSSLRETLRTFLDTRIPPEP